MRVTCIVHAILCIQTFTEEMHNIDIVHYSLLQLQVALPVMEEGSPMEPQEREAKVHAVIHTMHVAACFFNLAFSFWIIGERQKQDSNKLGMSKKERTTDGAAHSRIFGKTHGCINSHAYIITVCLLQIQHPI